MSDIKPVYQVQQLGEWIEVDKSIFDEIYIQNKFPHRILYPAAAYEALQKENARLQWKKDNVYRLGLKANEALKAENAAQAKRIEEAVRRIKDMLENDDGQAHKEARKFIESLSASKNGE